jgi:hypothetical protein
LDACFPQDHLKDEDRSISLRERCLLSQSFSHTGEAFREKTESLFPSPVPCQPADSVLRFPKTRGVLAAIAYKQHAQDLVAAKNALESSDKLVKLLVLISRL